MRPNSLMGKCSQTNVELKLLEKMQPDTMLLGARRAPELVGGGLPVTQRVTGPVPWRGYRPPRCGRPSVASVRALQIGRGVQQQVDWSLLVLRADSKPEWWTPRWKMWDSAIWEAGNCGMLLVKEKSSCIKPICIDSKTRFDHISQQIMTI